MKGVLEFNLPEEQDDFDRAKDALHMSIAIYEFYNYLRGRIKYEENPEILVRELEIIREKFIEVLNDNDVAKYA